MDPVSQRWTTVPVPYSMDHARAFVTQAMPGGWEAGEEWGFAVEYDGGYGGTVSLRNRGEGRAEIAYGSHPAVRGTGAMERALRLLLGWGFSALELDTVVWWANRGNWASRKLAHRVGFSFDGTVRSWLPDRGRLVDGWVGSLLRGDALEPRSIWLDCPTLEAEGLQLRPWRQEDAGRVVEGCSDATTQWWLGQLPSPYTLRDALEWFEASTERRATGQAVNWAVVDPARPDRPLGSVGFFDHTPGVEVEVGYWVHPEARGRGVARRATRGVTRYAFDTLGVRRVKACAAVENVASRRVLEGSGMRFTGIERLGANVRAGRVDMALYDVLAEEWPEVCTRWSEADQSSTATPTTESAAPTSAGER